MFRRRPCLLRYAFALLATGLGLLPAIVFAQHCEAGLLLLVGAVAASAWYGGFGPAALATVVGALGSAYPALAGGVGPRLIGPLLGLDLAVFGVVALLTSALVARLRAGYARAETARAALAHQLWTGALLSPPVDYRAVLDGLQDALLVADAEGRIVELNQALVELSGFTPVELRQLGAGILLASSGWAPADRATFAREGHWQGLLRLRRKDGTDLSVEASVRALDSSPDARYVAALRDPAARSAPERDQLNVLAMVGHELRVPLTLIMGWGEILQSMAEYNPRAVSTIVAQARKLDRLVGDLLDVARLGRGGPRLRLAPVDLVEVVRAVALQAPALGSGDRVRVVAPDRPLIGRFDADRLQQVVGNLLSNALKYGPAGGQVLITIDDLGAEARVSVTDSGIGIAPDALPRIFEPYFRADGATGQGDGLGLGLHIAKLLVEAHGGQITAESVPDQGSTFSFTLPYR